MYWKFWSFYIFVGKYVKVQYTLKEDLLMSVNIINSYSNSPHNLELVFHNFKNLLIEVHTVKFPKF